MKNLLLTCVLSALAAAPVLADEAAKLDPKTYEQMVTKGIDYLKTKGQAPDGSYSGQAGPGVTALITTAILRQGRSPDDPLVAKSLKYLEGFVREDGGISKAGSKLPNYETCLAILCFQEANKDGRYDKILKKADGYIKKEQWDEGEEKTKSDVNYGGAGYGGKSRPDLSNTAFLVDALKATGNGAESEAIQRALLFVSRCQNLETELTIDPKVLKNPDGGFFYTPAAGGASPAGDTADGGLRSYGAMTYAGLKSMLYAGVGPEDKRVKAALTWLGKHYSVEENPGMGQRGVYYYYHTFAKALDAMGQDEFADEKGVKHNWRNELIAELAKRQRPDGSWANSEQQWMEGDANLATGFALLTLSYCKSAK